MMPLDMLNAIRVFRELMQVGILETFIRDADAASERHASRARRAFGPMHHQGVLPAYRRETLR
jgi:hypothetical protein